MVFVQFITNNFPIKLLIFLTILVTIVSSASLRLDNNDLDTILNDPTERAKYLDCLRGVAQCTEDGQKLKDAFQEVIKTNDTSRVGVDDYKLAAKKVMDFFVYKVPNDVRNFVADVQSQNGRIWDRFKDMVRKPINWLHEKVNDDDINNAVLDMYQDGPTIIVTSKKAQNWNGLN